MGGHGKPLWQICSIRECLQIANEIFKIGRACVHYSRAYAYTINISKQVQCLRCSAFVLSTVAQDLSKGSYQIQCVLDKLRFLHMFIAKYCRLLRCLPAPTLHLSFYMHLLRTDGVCRHILNRHRVTQIAESQVACRLLLCSHNGPR